MVIGGLLKMNQARNRSGKDRRRSPLPHGLSFRKLPERRSIADRRKPEADIAPC
jgi:hypothetical protein